ncbi:hypothetical protein CRYUN_Cryun38cG0045300 [Craigia yunnanensis]
MANCNPSSDQMSDELTALKVGSGSDFKVHVFSSSSENKACFSAKTKTFAPQQLVKNIFWYMDELSTVSFLFFYALPKICIKQLLGKLQEKWSSVKKKPYPAMYSSIFGGIILDPAMMVIPIDDHMVHRRHGVFDIAIILDGWPFRRFLRSAAKARISPPIPQSTLRSILVQLTAASQCKKGTLRYWLSAGPGNFLLSPAGCLTSAFYAVVIDDDFSAKEGLK